jgi:hypothetical protein
MKRLGFWIVAVITGLLLGAGSAVLVLSQGAMIGAVDNAHWRTNRAIGSPDADPYTRAVVARAGLLALNQSETVYYFRTEDDAGEPLRGDCTYVLTGPRLPARWWSITLYDGDFYLAVNGDDAHSIDATSVQAAPHGVWRVRVGPERGDDVNWISSANAGSFSLSLRLYNPDDEVRADLAGIALPHLTRDTCAEDAP